MDSVTTPKTERRWQRWQTAWQGLQLHSEPCPCRLLNRVMLWFGLLSVWWYCLSFPIACFIGVPLCSLRIHLYEISSLQYHIRTFFRTLSWFKLNDASLFPGQRPRRFFESDRENLHTSSMSPYDTSPTQRFYFYFFAWFFVSKYCLGNRSILDLFRPNIFGEKNEKNGD